MLKHSKILVTGSTGFLGSYVTRLLVQEGYKVRAICRASSSRALIPDTYDNLEWVEGDTTDLVSLEDAFEGVSHVVHCAGITAFESKEVPRMNRVNIDGTANMVNLALDFGVEKFIHVSSIAAIGRSKNDPVVSEKTKWATSSLNTRYAVSKYTSEQEVWRGHAEGLPVAIVNPAMILGAGFWNQGTAKFFRQIDQGLKFVPVGHSGFVDVRDVARFMLLLLESDLVGERYIMCAENWPYRRLFEEIAAGLGKKAPGITVTPLLAEVAWRVEWLKNKLTGLPPTVTRESARASVSKFSFVNDKSRAVFNFTYRPLAETIRDTTEAYKKGGETAFLNFP